MRKGPASPLAVSDLNYIFNQNSEISVGTDIECTTLTEHQRLSHLIPLYSKEFWDVLMFLCSIRNMVIDHVDVLNDG